MQNDNLQETDNKLSGKKSTLSNIPRRDADMLGVFRSVNLKWDEAQFVIAWITKARFVELVNTFYNLLLNRKTVGASRGSVTEELKDLNLEIDRSIEHVKNKLAETYGSKKEAMVHYPAFGIVKESSYKLPKAKEKRFNNMNLLINGLKLYGFENMTYGLQYWTDIQERYNRNIDKARHTDGSVSVKVGNLDEMRDELRLFCNSFIHIVRGNHPVQWRNIIRDYGFQKEKY